MTAVERMVKEVAPGVFVMYSQTRNNSYFWIASRRLTKKGRKVYDRIGCLGFDTLAGAVLAAREATL